MQPFEGLKVLVTGGASGIGLAAARLFAEQGGAVAVLDVQPTADAAPVLPAASVYVQADVTDSAAVARVVAEAVERLGGLDVLVNNVGIGAQGDIEANDEREWTHVLDVNVIGIVRVTRAALPALRRSRRAALEARQPHGRLVTASEVAHAIAYLAAPTSGSTTGTTLAVDGGLTSLRLRSAV